MKDFRCLRVRGIANNKLVRLGGCACCRCLKGIQGLKDFRSHKDFVGAWRAVDYFLSCMPFIQGSIDFCMSIGVVVGH